MTPGLHPDVPSATYHADCADAPSLSSSIAKILVTRTPLHAFRAHPRLGGGVAFDGTDATDRGDIIHGLALGGGRGYIPVDADDWRTKAAKEARESIRADGKVPVLVRVLAECQKAADVIRPMLPTGLATEVTGIWESDGVLCRMRMDAWLESMAWICDLKIPVNGDANFTMSASNMVRMGYDIQAAAYIEGVETLKPELAGRVTYEWLCPELEDPCPETTKRVECAGSMLELGRQRWARAKAIWKRCLAAGKWPGYPVEAVRVECPAWALGAELDATAMDEGRHDGDAF